MYNKVKKLLKTKNFVPIKTLIDMKINKKQMKKIVKECYKNKEIVVVRKGTTNMHGKSYQDKAYNKAQAMNHYDQFSPDANAKNWKIYGFARVESLRIKPKKEGKEVHNTIVEWL